MLGLGCVQEEIRFVLCPELLVSRLLTEELQKEEALLFIGESPILLTEVESTRVGTRAAIYNL